MSAAIPATILERLGLEEPLRATRIDRGHIHATWRVEHARGRLVLQRLNTTVFTDPAKVVANTEIIAAHLARCRARGAYPLEVPRQVPDRDGNHALDAGDGSIWRATEYVENTRTVDVVTDTRQALAAAAAFGAFAAAMADLDPALLAIPLPHFHDLYRRLDALERAAPDFGARAAASQSEIDFCLGQRRLADRARSIEHALPPRICHNDTKINNVLLDASSGAARAVIDLDTCMPGCWMHDYGDMVRTFCSPEPEDSTRLDAVRVREDIFDALTLGYLEALGDRLTRDERESLWTGALVMPLLVGVRFLTDYLEGNRYFAISRPGHNLDRARNQLALYRDLFRREGELAPRLGE